MAKQNAKSAPVQKPENAIQTDGYDPVLWGSVWDTCTQIQTLTHNAPSPEKRDARETVASDIFHSLYKSNPTLREEANPAQRAVLETMMGLPEYQDMRSSTRFDDLTSALGTMQLAPTILEQFEKLAEKQEKQEGETQGQGPGGEPGDGRGEAFDGETMDGVRRALRKAAKGAQESADEWEELKAGWGIKPGELARLSFKEKLELAETLKRSPNLKRIAELAGRFRNIALAAEAATPSHGMDEIVDVTQGDEIARLLPSELAKFKTAKTLFMKDFVEKQLMVYNLKGVEHVGCGPIIMLLDISGSMRGDPEMWAKAVILALASLAEKQRRPFGVITFDTKPRQEWYFPTGQLTIKDKIDIASIVSDGGGTDFYKPLKAGFKMRELTSTMKPADIVFTTDGDCQLTERQILEIAELKKTTSVRIYGVAVTDRYGSLDAFSDNISVIGNGGDISHVKDIMNKVASKTR